ncbi:MAG: hypothetical protein ACRDGM_15315 [bacterium]
MPQPLQAVDRAFARPVADPVPGDSSAWSPASTLPRASSGGSAANGARGGIISIRHLSKPKHRKAQGRRASVIAVTVLLALAIFAAITLAADSGFGALKGRWLRPDGGYILEIRNVDANGKIDAVYLNPRPISVARAEATRDGSTLKVFVELRAPGYPGSTYTLSYDPKRDQLLGVYFQAAIGQRFEVVFVRMK